jgi:hypothetical protein
MLFWSHYVILFAAYVVTALLCGTLALSAQRLTIRVPGVPHRLIWAGLSILIITLALGRYLDLGELPTAIMRNYAYLNDWYDVRRVFQAQAILAVLTASVVAFGVALWIVRRAIVYYWLTLFSTIFLLSYVAIRAISLHQVDALLRRYVAGAPLWVQLELIGILGVGVSTIPHLWRVARSPASTLSGLKP